MNKVLLIGSGLVVLAAIVFILIGYQNNPELINDPPKVGVTNTGATDTLDLILEDFSGVKVSLQELQGKPLVINAWAAWCPFCVDELPDFAAVQRELGDAVQIVAIDRAESLKTAQQYTDDLGIADDLTLLLDPQDSFYTSIGGFAMPETLFINSDGTLNFHKRGVMPISEIRQRIDELE